MRTKIAVFGSVSFCEKSAEYVLDRKEIALDLYSYDRPDGAPALLKNLRPCDAILFSGSLPYMASKEMLAGIPVPAVYLKQDETEIAATLLSIALRGPLRLSDLSIDVRNPAVLHNVLTASATSGEEPAVFPLEEDYSLQEVIDFHIGARQSGEAKLAVTSVHAAYDRLQALGIPAVQMISVKSSFLKTLDVLCQEALYHRSETSKAAVGILQTPDGRPASQELIRRLSSLLHAHSVDSGNAVRFYTTHGAIRTAASLPEFAEAAAAAEGQLAFGCGHTVAAAEEHAVSALRYMRADHPGGLYMLDEEKNLQNVLHLTREAVGLRVIEPVLAEIAETTALSPAVVTKLAQFGQNRQTMQFTANDLAEFLGVSRRTAERTIKKLLSSDYANTIGEEMTYRQGRPRSVYELSFPVY
ncbi:hypothetical protein NCCP2716_19690 [Sporosarcina sp. NCCP-2716]|uniref:HTH domain-containing protein n=1 Tax=Sporosarcina sp. NCCP-2716 TaxID=2943679 RepID=UPI00203C0A2F|nr:HTH domain-containing protein [Sporosarcina sp. NCCP-2716]GKV69471.1 hypothetical protein NCCP2716_19690 [Sporosarcina sp. NCCP-2716]